MRFFVCLEMAFVVVVEVMCIRLNSLLAQICKVFFPSFF
jgi:hypothetical protein